MLQLRGTPETPDVPAPTLDNPTSPHPPKFPLTTTLSSSHFTHMICRITRTLQAGWNSSSRYLDDSDRGCCQPHNYLIKVLFWYVSNVLFAEAECKCFRKSGIPLVRLFETCMLNDFGTIVEFSSVVQAGAVGWIRMNFERHSCFLERGNFPLWWPCDFSSTATMRHMLTVEVAFGISNNTFL